MNKIVDNGKKPQVDNANGLQEAVLMLNELQVLIENKNDGDARAKGELNNPNPELEKLQQEIAKMKEQHQREVAAFQDKLQKMESQIKKADAINFFQEIEHRAKTSDMLEKAEKEAENRAKRIIESMNHECEVVLESAKAESFFVGLELQAKNSELQATQAEIQQMKSFVNKAVSLGVGIGAACLVYNNPAMLTEMLQGLNYEIVNSVLPYSQLIASVGAGIISAVISSILGESSVYATMKLMQGLEKVVKMLLITLPLSIAKSLVAGIIDSISELYNFCKEYRGSIGLLIAASVLAYHHPETAMMLATEALEISYNAISGIAHFAAEYGVPMANTLYSGGEQLIPILNSANDTFIQYGTLSLDGLYSGAGHVMPMLNTINEAVIHYGNITLNQGFHPLSGVNFAATEVISALLRSRDMLLAVAHISSIG